MNNAVKGIIIFTSGLATGAVSMYFGVKKYFELKADLEIEQVRDAYTRRLQDIEPVKSSVDGDIEGPETIEDENVERVSTKSSIVRELNNKPPMTDYTKFFKAKDVSKLDIPEISRDPKEDMIENELAEAEGPKDDEEMTEEEDIEATADYEMYQINKDHQEALKENRPPFIIEADDYELTCSHYAKITLHYYVSDDLLVTDEDEIVQITDQLGNCLEDSGFLDNSDDVLYIRNDIMMADYEIVKVYTPFEG